MIARFKNVGDFLQRYFNGTIFNGISFMSVSIVSFDMLRATRSAHATFSPCPDARTCPRWIECLIKGRCGMMVTSIRRW
jgi:hypothetical protein